MNPSGRGWIHKLIKLLETNSESPFESLEVLYPKLRTVGFVYGSNVITLDLIPDNPDYTKEERCKINLLSAFYAVYSNSDTSQNFEVSLWAFYKEIKFHKSTLINKVLGADLESIIHKRIHIDNNLFTKNFSYFVTNSLLFVDVIAYRIFLKNQKKTTKALKRIENSIRILVVNALNSKSDKNDYDHSLIKLLEASLRFTEKSDENYTPNIKSIDCEIEALFYLDLVCMATWSDLRIDSEEEKFLNKLGAALNVSKAQIIDAETAIDTFYAMHKNKIALLSSKNLVQSFYDNSSLLVRKLISRNSKRLYKELKESKELVQLLSQSTVRNLSKDEQKQMQVQLMDILKSIPSLAIFMLPGGAFLLPLFIKFIPKLLPSAFDDNRVEE